MHESITVFTFYGQLSSTRRRKVSIAAALLRLITDRSGMSSAATLKLDVVADLVRAGIAVPSVSSQSPSSVWCVGGFHAYMLALHEILKYHRTKNLGECQFTGLLRLLSLVVVPAGTVLVPDYKKTW
jgi:hypothetical protein